jgi:prophage regulatory protein
MNTKLLKAKQICEKIGFSLPTLWRKVKNDPTFPKPFKIGANSTAWDAQEIDAWIENCKAVRGK